MPERLYERASWVFDHVPASGISTLLDVGCFDAAGTAWLHAQASTVVGIDLDMEGLQIGRRLNHSVHLSCASATSLPFRADFFDCVVFSETLEHIPPESEYVVLQEIHRVLRPGGRLVLTVPHAGLFQVFDSMNFSRNIRQFLRWLGLAKWSIRLQSSRQADIKGHKHYSQTELLTLLSPLFSVQCVERSGLFLYPLSLLMGLLPRKILRWRPMAFLRKHMADWDYRHDFGWASYNIALVACARTTESTRDR